MQAPADKVVKRLSREEWFQRYDAIDLWKRETNDKREAAQRNAPPADRVAVRS